MQRLDKPYTITPCADTPAGNTNQCYGGLKPVSLPSTMMRGCLDRAKRQRTSADAPARDVVLGGVEAGLAADHDVAVAGRHRQVHLGLAGQAHRAPRGQVRDRIVQAQLRTAASPLATCRRA